MIVHGLDLRLAYLGKEKRFSWGAGITAIWAFKRAIKHIDRVSRCTGNRFGIKFNAQIALHFLLLGA